VANALLDSVIHSQPPAAARTRRRVWSRWPKWILLLLILLWLADAGISVLIRHTRVQRKLTARLEAAFGRPVEVGGYGFSLWRGPALEAQSVTVGEDPRFGREYFLRAESLTVRLRWQGLLRGHLELGTVSLMRPSLNLVRNAEGDWNLAEWLPKPAGVSPASGAVMPGASAVRVRPSVRFGRIEVDSGRINFKRGDEKLPFALVGVTGYVEPESPGRWSMNLVAVPTRAAVIVQQAGILHLSGHLGGTSSRLRPAALDISWSDASLPDVLRLARSYDYGVRGALALTMNARTADNEDSGWNIQSRVEFRQLHRWDLALRPDNPSVNVTSKVYWNPATPVLVLRDATIEGPHSHADADMLLALSPPPGLVPNALPFSIDVPTSTIDLNDALAWLRAFHSDVADDISVHGFATLQIINWGWAPRIPVISISIPGADLTSPRLRVPVHVGNVDLSYKNDIISLAPVSLAFGAPGNAFRMETAAKPGSREAPGIHLTGNLAQVRDLISTASALGWNISRGWNLGGPLRCDLRWPAVPFPWRTQPTGTIDWGGESGGLSLRTPFLNQPILGVKAHADWKPDVQHITLSSAEAFGARWTGSLDHRNAGGGWQFALSADHIAAADLDRWLNPRWRQSFLDRMLPFLNPRSPTNAVTDALHASGRITLDQFTLAPVVVRHLQGDVKIEGHHIDVANAKAQLYGGNIGGSFEADLTPTPSYRANLDFSQVDLSALTAASPALADLFAGSASGQVSFSTHGASHSDLLDSLECRGAAHVNDPVLHNLNLADSIREGARHPGTSSFHDAKADFTCADRQIKIRDLVLLGPIGEISGSGSLDFATTLDMRLRAHTSDAAPRNARFPDSAQEIFQLTGTLSAPQIVRVPPLVPNP
jgi:hypothetical protein